MSLSRKTRKAMRAASGVVGGLWRGKKLPPRHLVRRMVARKLVKRAAARVAARYAANN